MAGVVARAFLLSFFQVINERLDSHSGDLIHHDDEVLLKKLEIKPNSINEGLDVAETKQFQNPNVRNWLDRCIHELYEVEQLLDVMATYIQQKVTRRSFLSGFNINRRFEYRMEVLLRNLKFLLDQKDILGLQELTSGDYEIGVRQKLLREFRTLSLVDESVIYGRNHEKEEIVDFLLSDSDNRVLIISIVGLIGIGKTTLVQLVYNDHRIVKQFELKAFVHVPESFDLVSLTQSILRSFDSSAVDSEDFEILQRQMQQLLTSKKFLLVLDGIWDVDENTWEKLLLFKCGSSGSKMIVTTHDKEVASSMGSTRILHLKQLEESNSWSLFVRYAFRGKNVFEYPNLELIGKRIVEKCGGLPLALKRLGTILGTKFSEPDWVEILETDCWHLPVCDSNINSILRLSYLNLPSNLKRCFAYCSIFPKGYEFEKDEVIKLWMEEGLLNRKYEGKIQNEEELGNEFFDHLVTILFFQQSVTMPLWAGKYYIMHDLVNDLEKLVSGEFRFRIEDDHVQHIPERTRHIWFCLDLEGGDRKLKQIHKIKGLYSLMVEAQGYGDKRFKISPNVQQSLFSRLKYLRTLSFSGCNLSELADEIRSLKLLRYLDLSYTEITSLPNSICKLYNLQTLIARLF